MYRIFVIPYLLSFKRPAVTSRGVYTVHKVWYVMVRRTEDLSIWGIGECAPLRDLSCDAAPDYEERLRKFCKEIESTGILDKEKLRPYPSMLFGLETAFRQLEAGSFKLYDTSFSKGKTGIPINGLIWMGDYRQMLEQVEEKILAGFSCIKLKIGAIRFEEEIRLLTHIRRHFSVHDIELRVDANGAFELKEAMRKLERLAVLDIHSIEQPIAAGQYEEMAKLTAVTPIPIALDEELIGIHACKEKIQLLQQISPQYIILKPSLHGGITGCDEWIELADKSGIGWWVTSALESNIGLNAIAQWCATYHNELPQGLGTGTLYHNNFDMPLRTQKDKLYYLPGEAYPVYSEYFDFLAEWNNLSETVRAHTSGSTGMPKEIFIRKSAMRESAGQTNSILGLQPGNKALLCMPLQYIGAKMMVVRAETGQLELIVRKPSGHPMADVKEKIDFAAMTPQQVYNSLLVPEEKERLKQIGCLIIGGAAIPTVIEEELKSFPNAVYSTYGMTETVSHIALRRLSGVDASDRYIPFSNVRVSLSRKDTLMIRAPFISGGQIVTNDIVELYADNSFRILGRADNVINTGGIKVQIEAVEQKLSRILSTTFAIIGRQDEKFGEAVVLMVERPLTEEEHTLMKNALTRYEYPKQIITVEKIPLTPNGKIAREKCKHIITNN